MLFLPNIAEGTSQLSKALPEGIPVGLHILCLMIGLQQRDGHHQPPCCCNDKGNGHRRRLADAQLIAHKHDHKAGNKGNAGANISKGIPLRRYIVHAIIRGGLRQHCVIEHQR